MPTPDHISRKWHIDVDGGVLRKTQHTPSGYPIYNAYIADLAPDEYDLNDGRFLHYTDNTQPYPVVRIRTIRSGDELRIWCNRVLDWVGFQMRHPWTFDVELLHVHAMRIRFEFSTSTDAVLFALTWR